MMKKIGYIILFFVFLVCASCNKENASQNDSSNDGKGGSLATFALKGAYLYVVDEANLNVFQVKTPQNPSKVNSIPIGFNIETLFSAGDYLFVGSRNGMYIYSVEEPEKPKMLSKAEHFTACDPVVSDLDFAYVTLHSGTFCRNSGNALQIYDVKNLRKPKLIYEMNLSFPRGLALEGDLLVVCDDKLKFFSVENPYAPELVYSVNRNFKDVVFYQGKLFAFGEREIAQYQWSTPDFSDFKLISSLKY
ncbi:LVIVD repeat-containing protein [Capnocytophaga canimorsus]|uniref:LVIVD repeat-containing protein n=1 Tax=Capnocytophaga canimorsus TaxID=28188 RepID=UPI001AD2533F|nr:hypothetical protein [Capnocytophaga canimorsus]GIM59706.1 hypothetical protein CAPN007_19150 [Capnocytophaga canimorsus]